MPRYRLTLEYDGGPYHGWQRQENGASIQQALEEAVFRLCGETVTVAAAGRTDAGVHARGQVAQIDLVKDWDPFRLGEAINFHLKPQPIAVVECGVAEPGWHARFSAVERRYLYRIVNRRAPLVLDRGHAWQISRPLDAAAMHEAAQVLVGQHDFTSFRAALCQAASPVKTISELTLERVGAEVHLHARARSFLHHQIRNIIGTLALVGLGKWSASDVRAALEARDRGAAGETAPAAGLYFMAVRYGGLEEVAQDPDQQGDGEVE